MNYTMDNAKWTDHGWENGIFEFSYGDFIDTDGDEFYFLIEYRKADDEFVFFMMFEFDEIIYGCGEQTDEFFERHMSKELMEATKEYMKKLMKY